MSRINWKKNVDRQRMQRQGTEDKAGPSKDALRREADKLLAGYAEPVTKVPARSDSEATFCSRRKVEKAIPAGRKSKAYRKQIDFFAPGKSIGKSGNIGKAVPPGIVIYCDGACEPNPGIGGWGFVVYRDGVEIHSDCGGSDPTTNNIMELTGALMALRWIETRATDAGAARLFCDSMYVVNGCNDWRHGWKKKGWRRGVEKELANADLWKELDEALTLVPLTLEWVKGHAGIIGNERADELSLMGREAVLEIQPDPLEMIREQLDYSARGWD